MDESNHPKSVLEYERNEATDRSALKVIAGFVIIWCVLHFCGIVWYLWSVRGQRLFSPGFFGAAYLLRPVVDLIGIALAFRTIVDARIQSSAGLRLWSAAVLLLALIAVWHNNFSNIQYITPPFWLALGQDGILNYAVPIGVLVVPSRAKRPP